VIMVELGAVHRLIDQVGDDLAGRLVGRGLPKPLQGQIRNIVKTSLVLENFEKTYRLYDWSPGNVRVGVQVNYDVRNYSDLPINYSPEASEEVFYNPEFLRLEYRLSVSAASGAGSNYSYDETTLQHMVRTIEETHVKKVKGPEKVSIPPSSQDDEAVCKVRWTYRLTMRDNYSDVTSFGNPAINATIYLDQKPEELEFVSVGESLEHTPDSHTWVFKRPFIKGQHIRVWWRPKTPVEDSINPELPTALEPREDRFGFPVVAEPPRKPG
jgi:hypothetical protein